MRILDLDVALRWFRSYRGKTERFVVGGGVAALVAIAPVPAFAEPSSDIQFRQQRAVLYEEDPDRPKGIQYAGNVIWRIEPVAMKDGMSAEVAIRGDVVIPDRNLRIVLTIRRNTDAGLPASHVAELTFAVPKDFEGGGIDSVPGLLMKMAEQARGRLLVGSTVKVTSTLFIVGLSNKDSDRQANLLLLQESGWFDIPVVYANRRRAILAIAKGSAGDRTFRMALTAWDGGPPKEPVKP